MKYQVDRPYAGSLPEIHTNGPTTVVPTTSYRKVVLLLRNATRRWATVLAALALALAGLVGATGSASATLQVTNCNSASGSGSIVDTFYVNVGGDGAHVGAVQLCTKDTYYWAYVVFYAPMPAGNWGQATLNHYHNGVKTGVWTCDSPGGNGHVAPGQTQCWTPKIHRAGAADLFSGDGDGCYGDYPICDIDYAWGSTHIKA
jgi:hypothetical protein